MSTAPVQVLEPPPAPPESPAPRESFIERVRLLLRPSNFIASVPGPIFQKDVWISGRKGGTYWIRGLYAALLLTVIGFFFIGISKDLNRTQSHTARLQDLQTLAPIATLIIIWFEFVALTLAGAIFGAPAICEEKRAGTLATLLTTPLKAWQIVIGKTMAFFVQLMILTLIAAPLLLAIRVFGGVSAEHILAGTALSLATALLAGLCGLYHSIGVKRTPSAILAGIVSTIFLQALVPLIGLLILWQSNGRVSIEWMFFNFSTPIALGRLTYEAQVVSGDLATMAWISSTLYTLGLCVIVLVAASFRLRGVMAREGAGGSAIPRGAKTKKSKPTVPSQPASAASDPPSLGAAALSAALNAPEPAESADQASHLPNVKRKRRRSSVQEGVSRVVGDQPVLWREMRQQVFRTKAVLVTALAFVAACLGVLYHYVGLDEEGLHIVLTVLATVIMLVTGTVTASSVVSGERESRTWEVLLTTPLSAWDIVVGKAAGAVRRQWFVPLVLSAHLLIAVVFTMGEAGGSRVSPSIFLWLLLICVPPVLFLSATGTLFSLLCRKSATAAAANLGLALALWAGFPAFTGWSLYVLFGRPSWANEAMSIAMVSNPVGMIAFGLQGALSSRDYALYDLGEIGFDGFLIASVVHAALYVGGAFLALRLASSFLAQRTARAK